jgi:hypothetical protein
VLGLGLIHVLALRYDEQTLIVLGCVLDRTQRKRTSHRDRQRHSWEDDRAAEGDNR